MFNCGSKVSTNNQNTSKATKDTKAKKQNILFIAIDDLRPLINAYGAKQMITPNLDKLAREGLQFNNAYTNIPVCGASRASIMTGIRPSQSRFASYKTKASEDTPNATPLNKIFRDNGYETISYGKIYHHGNDFEQYWSERGIGGTQSDYQDPVSIKRRSNAEKGPFGNKGLAFEYPEVGDYAYNDGKITKIAINKLKELKANDRPFFLAVGYVSPHLPFIQPKKYWDMYDHDAIQLSDNPEFSKSAPPIAQVAQHFSSELRKLYLDIPQEGYLGDDLSRNLVHGYYASVTYMDALIGELIKGLEELGLRENTTIVLWSDHGFFLGEHGFWTKHSTFLEAVKIPLIISSPKYSKNEKTESMAELVDIYPTLCDIAQITAPSYLDGESLVPVLKNPSTIQKKEIYTRFDGGETIIDNNYSYTEYYKGEKYMENMLYDMHNDLKQNNDISNDPSNAGLVAKYKEKLKVMRAEINKGPI
jgi:arylsulfatase A-like enzyme